MTGWESATPVAIAGTDDLHIAPHRANGVPGTPTWIWSVVVDGNLDVRAYHGTIWSNRMIPASFRHDKAAGNGGRRPGAMNERTAIKPLLKP